jgi:hypothetical protein
MRRLLLGNGQPADFAGARVVEPLLKYTLGHAHGQRRKTRGRILAARQ